MAARPQPAGQGDKGIVVRRARLPPSQDHSVPEGREKQGHPLCQWKAPVGAFGVRPGWGKPPSHQAKAVLQSHTETPNPIQRGFAKVALSVCRTQQERRW